MTLKSDTSSSVVLQCDHCGRRFEHAAGEAAPLCPDCGSEGVSGVTLWGGSVEYALADRSQGYALEDIRFGKLAQWTEMILPNQYTDAMSAQRERLGAPGRIPSLAEVLISQGVLNKRQVEAILTARVEAWQDDSDEKFGKLAMEKLLLTTAQYVKAREVQLELNAKGREVPPLPLIVYEKRFMQENAVLAVLRLQEMQGRGLSTLVRLPLERKGPPITEVLLGRKKSPERRKRLVGGAAILVIVLLIGWWEGAFTRTEYVETQCAQCHVRNAAPLGSKWPLTCSNCGKVAAYPEAVCRKCGKVFIIERRDPGEAGVKCPACGSTNFVLVTKDVNVAQIQQALGEKVKTGEKDKRSETLDQSLEGMPQ